MELIFEERGVEILRYAYQPDMPVFESPKPYFHPIRTLAGDVVSAYRPHDHRWHKGLAMTVSDLSGENFWGGGSYVRAEGGYVDLPNNGTMRHESFDDDRESEAGDHGVGESPAGRTDTGELRVDESRRGLVTSGQRTSSGGRRVGEALSWHTQSGEHWVDEARSFAVVDVEEDSWALEFATALTNVRGDDLVFGSPTTNGRPLAGYCGLFWRGPRSFEHGTVIASHGDGPSMMGRPSDWLAYVGAHDEVDRSSTLLFMSAQPTLWFVRNTPFAAVNPSIAFDEELVLPAGGTLSLRYRVVVGCGAWDRARLEAYAKEHPCPM
ncbi:PmoA family protein [Acrocarpospora catenulata]|uniref:DUF6807 domain-containing protein n=1 Tax=Acrocarpospora catenulata TaxID=2836182 RepID=UPI001BD9BCE7|nr:PmoA family protein [Acrocarpospora catenulata]